MSSHTPSFQTGSDSDYSTPPTRRPAYVPLLALLGVLWALAGLLLIIGTIYVVMIDARFDHPIIQDLRHRSVNTQDTTLFNYLLMSSVPGVVAMLVLLVGSAATLAGKDWGRRWMILAAVIEVLRAGANGYMVYREYQHAGHAGVIRFGAILIGAHLLLPLLILLLLTGRRVRAAFAESGHR